MRRRTRYQAPWYAYDAFVVEGLRAFLQDALPRTVRPGALVLDVGCGEQPLRHLIERLGGRYVGIDYAPNERRTTHAVGSLLALPVASAAVDLVILTEVLEHVPDLAGALREVHRVLAPGGRAVVTVPFLYPLHEEPSDFDRPTPHLIRLACAQCGLSIEQLVPLGDALAAAATLLDHAWPDRGGMVRLARLATRVAVFGTAHVLRGVLRERIVGGAPVGHGLVLRK